MFYIMNNLGRFTKWGIRGGNRLGRARDEHGDPVASDRQALGVLNHDFAEVALALQVT
ncbi:hypothetical protein B0G73_12958 [Paraburkholderia sp. BL25I1N1]|nr:hypothetical protein B0G73_12958 [Paraburkholderia sp. BL25I1N1]